MSGRLLQGFFLCGRLVISQYFVFAVQFDERFEDFEEFLMMSLASTLVI